jgi:acyl-CoA synthetase (AMP-forming)/AMP-acid ligase II
VSKQVIDAAPRGGEVSRLDAARKAPAPAVWSSPYPPLDPRPATPLEAVLEAARRAPDKPALVEADGQAVSFETLAERIERVAAGLAGLGFAAGDVLALCAPNVPPWAGVALGAMRAGGAVAGVMPGASEDELARQLATTRARVLVCAPEVAGLAARAAARAGVERLVTLGEAPAGHSILALLASDAPAPAMPTERERLALLPSSSGTTGLPKAVMLTHGNLAAGVAQVQAGLRFRPEDTVLAVAPFAHVMGFVGGLAAPLAAGATVVTLARFALPPLLAALERHRVTVLIVPPPVAAALAAQAGAHDLSALELVVVGGAPLAPELQSRLAARLPRAAIGQGYGMTETTLAVPVPDRADGTPPGAVGRLAPGTTLQVLDPATGRALGPGAAGELCVRGPQVTPGYLDRPDATAELIDADGRLHTGDLGFVDDAGYVHVVDRLKELIKVNALQVAPAELEALLATHPAVADAAVAGRPDPRTGEAPVAVVVAREPLDPAALIAWAAARTAPHKRLAAVVLAEAIPRTPAGKIRRREVARLAAAAVQHPYT